jgi:hypothetical protein
MGLMDVCMVPLEPVGGAALLPLEAGDASCIFTIF